MGARSLNGRLADNHDGTGRVVRAVLADRAERPARVVATVAEHEKLRIPGRVEQHSDGVALYDVRAMCLWSYSSVDGNAQP